MASSCEEKTVVGINHARFSAQVIGMKDTLTVLVKNVTNLGAFQFELAYDQAVLRLDTCVIGDFIGSNGREVDQIGPISVQGQVLFLGAVTKGGKDGPNGDGPLATLIVEAKTVGISKFVLRNVLLTDIRGDSIKIERKQELR